MRRLAITLLIGPLMGLAGLSLLAPTAHASTDTTISDSGTADSGTPDSAGDGAAADLPPVDVLQVSGLFDAVTVDSIIDTIADAERNGSQAVILQLNTRGAIVSNDDMRNLLQHVADAKVAIGIWVGPSRDSRAYGVPAQLFGVADVTAMVAGSRIGYTGDLLELDGATVDLGPDAAALRNGSMSFGEARANGVLRLDTDDEGVPTVRSMVLAMDGVQLSDGSVLDTVAEELNDNGKTDNVATLVRFTQLGLLEEMFHTIASPPMAYLFLVIGLCLLIFEFFTAGVGVAGVVGVVCAFFGCYGLAALPTRPGAVALLLAAMVAYAIDVQVGIPRFWTGAGTVMFVLGSWFLYEPLPGHDLSLSWLTLLVGICGVLLTFVVGMPSMVRTRFATPTIGRDWMIGSEGTAVGAVDPEGVAQVGAAKWRARTNRATPIKAGDRLRVVAIDGITLEVEPIEGAARDYRERRAKGEADGAGEGTTADAATGSAE